MIETLVFDAVDAYVALHAAAWPDLAAAGAIIDARAVRIPTDQTFAIVGCDDPTVSGLTNAVDQGHQDWQDLGAFSRLETFTIWSTLICWTGNTNADPFSALRATAKGYINLLGAALRPAPNGTGDAMLGAVLNSGGAGWCGLSVDRMKVDSAATGSVVHVQYSLACTARI